MKAKTYIIIAVLALLAGFASCKKDHDIPTGTVFNEESGGGNTQDSLIVSVSANPNNGGTVTGGGTYQQGRSCTVTATANEGYTFINWTENGNQVSTDASYTFTVTGNRTLVASFTLSDYSKIILNELNGNDKFIEILNTGAAPINLNGVYIEKDGSQNWVGDNTVTIEPGAYLLLYSEDVTLDHPDVPESLFFHSSLSAKKNIRIQLFTPAGESIDDFNLVDIDANDTAYIPAPASYSRNADGNWYYADATPGALNVEGTVALLGLEGGDTPEPPTPNEPDYTNIILNELNGDTKFIEIYNKGDMDLTLEGMYLLKDDYAAGAIWTADATVVAPAYGYVVLYSEDVQADLPNYPEALFFHSGLSAKKTIRITLFMPDGTVRDEFTRGTTGEWGVTVSNVAPQSYARTPNGGDWKLAEPTLGTANPATGDDIPDDELPNNYTITVSANPPVGGTVTGGGAYEQGQQCTATATANTGYTFTNWTENGNVVSTQASYTFVVNNDRTLVANFSQQSYTITASANPSNGGSVSGGGNYNYGQSCTLTATAAEGYTFLRWTENGNQVSTSANYTFTVTSNRTLVANYTYNGGGTHEYVDLGLPSGLLWATCNVGADNPEDYGDYFAWGETQPKDYYDWSTYQYCMGSQNMLTKYCNDSNYGYNGFTDNLTTLLPEDDAATAQWGSGWRMPTKDEWQELYQNTTYVWTTQNGVNGRLFTATNGNSLFLSAAGYRWGSELRDAGSLGYYWSSSCHFSSYAYVVFFDCCDVSTDGWGVRYYGHSVRLVCPAE